MKEMIKELFIPNPEMYFDVENGTETEEDFFTALTLLHSTNADSAERLRKILDASITKKCGSSKTLAARMCRDSFSSFTETSGKSEEIEVLNESESMKNKGRNIEELPRNGEFRTNVKLHGYSRTAIIRTKIGQQMANVLVDDDRMEIPTISIPDEGSSACDDALCKICDGAKLGPLILLECQECQDVYHPLCHQPPVLDLDIYDPRLVWHCAKCLELSDAAAAPGLEDEKFAIQKSMNLENGMEIKGEITNSDSKDDLNYFRKTRTRLNCQQKSLVSDQFQLRNTTSIGRRSANRQTKTMEQVFGDRNGSFKNGQALAFSSTSSSGLHLRKRVGSKLTITRTTAKLKNSIDHFRGIRRRIIIF